MCLLSLLVVVIWKMTHTTKMVRAQKLLFEMARKNIDATASKQRGSKAQQRRTSLHDKSVPGHIGMRLTPVLRELAVPNSQRNSHSPTRSRLVEIEMSDM